MYCDSVNRGVTRGLEVLEVRDIGGSTIYNQNFDKRTYLLYRNGEF